MGGVIILVAVLFFVSVYGVREGFYVSPGSCKKNSELSEVKFKDIKITTKYNQKMDSCYNRDCTKYNSVESNDGPVICYSGRVKNDTNDITQAGLTATTYTPIAAASPNTGSTWQ